MSPLIKTRIKHCILLSFSFVWISSGTIHVWTWNKSSVHKYQCGHSRYFHNKPVEIKTRRQCTTKKWFIVNKLIGNFIKHFSVITHFWFPFFFSLAFFPLFHFFSRDEVKFRVFCLLFIIKTLRKYVLYLNLFLAHKREYLWFDIYNVHCSHSSQNMEWKNEGKESDYILA